MNQPQHILKYVCFQGLPSHWGPKIRHKKRDNANKGKQMKGHQNKSQRPVENMTPEGSTSPKTAKKKKVSRRPVLLDSLLVLLCSVHMARFFIVDKKMGMKIG